MSDFLYECRSFPAPGRSRGFRVRLARPTDGQADVTAYAHRSPVFSESDDDDLMFAEEDYNDFSVEFIDDDMADADYVPSQDAGSDTDDEYSPAGQPPSSVVTLDSDSD